MWTNFPFPTPNNKQAHSCTIIKYFIYRKFGFINQEAIEKGLTGHNACACNSQNEHEIKFIWSITSGKIQLYLDQRSIDDVPYLQKNSRRQTKQKEHHFFFQIRPKGEFHHKWYCHELELELELHAYAAPPLIALPQSDNNVLMQRQRQRQQQKWKQFDFKINGCSFDDLIKVYQIGSVTTTDDGHDIHDNECNSIEDGDGVDGVDGVDEVDDGISTENRYNDESGKVDNNTDDNLQEDRSQDMDATSHSHEYINNNNNGDDNMVRSNKSNTNKMNLSHTSSLHHDDYYSDYDDYGDDEDDVLSTISSLLHSTKEKSDDNDNTDHNDNDTVQMNPNEPPTYEALTKSISISNCINEEGQHYQNQYNDDNDEHLDDTQSLSYDDVWGNILFDPFHLQEEEEENQRGKNHNDDISDTSSSRTKDITTMKKKKSKEDNMKKETSQRSSPKTVMDCSRSSSGISISISIDKNNWKKYKQHKRSMFVPCLQSFTKSFKTKTNICEGDSIRPSKYEEMLGQNEPIF